MKIPRDVITETDMEFFLNFIQDCAKIGTWEYNIEEQTVSWSEETYKIHELPLSYKPNITEAINFYKEGYSRAMIAKSFKNCVENHKNYDVDLQIITSKGKEKWVRAIGKPIVKNGDCIKIIGLFQDIDEKTKNEKELAYREQVLQKTFDHALVGTVIIDLNGKFIDANHSFCKTFGYTKEEIKTFTFYDITHPDDIAKGRKAVMDLINGEINCFKTEKRYYHKSGKTIWASISGTIIRDNDGTPLHIVTQINDITQLKKGTQKIIDLLDTTENQNKRLLNFAHIVSHNLRSHFSNLDMLLDLEQMESPKDSENQIYPLLKKAVKHLGETVDNLNTVASINTKKDIQLESLNLKQAFNTILNSLSAQIIASKADISLDIDSTIHILGIPAYLDSIILNFLTNAIKYKKPNESPKIEIKTDVVDDYVIISIKDSGLGLDLERYGEKLFGMYKTFHRNKDSKGIGLFITKNQIEAIGGKVEIESEVNVGTTFKIHLKKASRD
ncbi:PAS domain-containing sensor histidine kinase [Neotamlana laminarinivorans]|uniref:histidine kinase n=1 Tax=Neotamlana laminarinivorans TaxID=2883124 RepID=A0A9X1I3N4_9FLAO|nr:PAS domain-containing sensor histidine kinase [Tamlana laminarinivorans]MCB4799622.1 PAS domain S-box protein [Tamlana laminarinivorans]